MFFNEPTMITQSFQNRASPLPSLILPDTSMNPNPYALEASNNYYDNILNKRTKKATFSNPILTLENVLPNKQKIISETKLETKNYLSVPTISNNILPSSLPMPSNPNLPPNPYELSKVYKIDAVTKNQIDNIPPMTKWLPRDYLYQGYYNNLLYNKDCINSPASCGGGSGGSRLGEDYNQSTKALSNVPVGINTLYPDSYTGSYFIEPNFDISRPIAFIPNKNKV